MKTIYSAGIIDGNIYKTTISDDMLNHVEEQRESVKGLDETVWIHYTSLCLNTEVAVPGYIIAGSRTTLVVSTVDRQLLLDFEEDLLSLPDIHVTKNFLNMLPEYVWCLQVDDIKLITNWLDCRDEEEEKSKLCDNLETTCI